MSSPIEQLSGIFTDYNELITRAKVRHKEIDIRIMQTSLFEIRGGERQREFSSEIQSQINAINETRVDEFDNPEDRARLRDLKLKIEELVREVFPQDRKRGREDESSQEPPLKMHVPPTEVGKRGREVESEEVESIKKQKQKPFDIIVAKYCSQEAPKDDAHVRAILRDINDGGRKKAFLLIPSDEHFTLYVLENGEIKSKLLSVDDSGQCTLYSYLRQESAAAKFNSFDEMKKSLGAFGLDARGSIENEKAIMAKYGVNFEPGKTALEIACSRLNKNLIKELLDNGSELDISMLKKCWDVFDEAVNQDHIEGCKKVLIEYAVDNDISLNSVIKESSYLGKTTLTTLFWELLEFQDDKFIEDMIIKSIEKYPNLLLQDDDGNTPLHWAINKGHVEFAELLIDKDAGLSVHNNYKITPLHLAIENGHTKIAELLIAKDAGLSHEGTSSNTPLYLAIIYDNKEIAKLLIDKDAGLTHQNDVGSTPLHLAIEEGRTEIAELLIGKGVGLSLQNKNGVTPLHLAIENGHTKIAELLIAKDAGLSHEGINSNTPLHLAIMYGNKEIAKLLIAKDAGLSLKNKSGVSPLHLAIKKGYTELAKLLIDKDAELLSVQDNAGETPLHLAIDKGDTEVAKFLIAKNVGLSLENKEGYTPLHFAIYKNNTELVQLLKDAGVYLQTNKGPTQLHLAIDRGNTELAKRLIAEDAGLLSLQNNMGDTPLHLAIAKDNTEIAKLLIEKGVGLDVQNKKGYTPLHVAMDNNKIELAKLLIKKNIGLSLQDEKGFSPLHCAIYKDNTELAKLLIDKDVGLSLQDKNGRPPLHWAIYQGKTELAKLLIDKDAGLALQDKEGYSPLHLAIVQGDKESSKLLVDKDAGLLLQDKNGRTPLHWAIHQGDIELAKLLIEKDAGLLLQNKGGQTPLHLAYELRNEDLIVRLLNKGANPYAADLSGNSLILNAVNQSPNEVPVMFKFVDDLLKSRERELRKSQDLPPVEDHLLKGLEYNKVPVDKHGDTLLHTASRLGHEKLLQFLIGKGINFADKNSYSETVFNIALDRIVYTEKKLKELLLEKENTQRSVEEETRNLEVLKEQHRENQDVEIRDSEKKIDSLLKKLTTIEKGVESTRQSLESLKKLAPVMANTITQIFEQYINNSKEILGDALSDASKFSEFETFIISRLPQILRNLKQDVNPLEFALSLNNLHIGRAIAKELGKDAFEAWLDKLPPNIKKPFKESLQYEINTTHLANKVAEIPDLPNEPEYQFRRALLETFDEVSGYKEENPEVLPSPEFGKYLGDVDKTRSLKALRESLEKFISNCEKKEKITGIEPGKEELFWNSVEKAITNTIKALSNSKDSPAEIKRKKALLMGEYLRLVGYCATRLDVEFDKLYYENCGIVRDLPGEIDFYLSERRRLVVEGLAPRGQQSVHTIQAMIESLDGYNIPIKKSPDLHPEKLVLIDPKTSFKNKYLDGLIDETKNFLQSNKDVKEAFFKMLEEQGRYGSLPLQQTRWFFEYLKDNNGKFPDVLPEGVGDPNIWKDIYEVFKNMPFGADDEDEWKQVLATYFHVTEWKRDDFAKIEASGNDAFKDLDPGLQKAVVDSGIKLDIFQTGSAQEKEEAKKKIQEKYIDDNFPTVSQKIKGDDVVFLLMKFNVLKRAIDAPRDVLF